VRRPSGAHLPPLLPPLLPLLLPLLLPNLHGRRSQRGADSLAGWWRLVAHAWRDAAFRARLLADATAAAAELGIAPRQRTLVLEDTPRAHRVIVCTLCSCSSSLTGQKPTWYKSPAYRARVVLEPRAALRECGLGLDDAIVVHVHDTSAEDRYFVLPQCPAGTDGYSEAQLAELVTPGVLLGVVLPHPTEG
jgi:nitrile hydratase